MNSIPSSRFNQRITNFRELKVADPGRVYMQPDPKNQVFNRGVNVPFFNKVKRF